MKRSFSVAQAACLTFAACGASALAWAGDFEPPRTASGQADFNGIWQTLSEANWGLEPRAAEAGPVMDLGAAYARPPSLGVVEGGEIPYQPWAKEQRDENFTNRLELDPEVKCYLPGVPRATYMPHPFQIIQGDEHIMLLYRYRGAVRTVNMKDHGPAPAPSWMGWSNGWFEGDTLLVETTGFNGMAWFDRAGNFHSEDPAGREMRNIPPRSEHPRLAPCSGSTLRRRRSPECRSWSAPRLSSCRTRERHRTHPWQHKC